MAEVVTSIYLALMFVALYMFSFFILLTIRNSDRLFFYPKAKKIYEVSVLIPAYNEEDNIEATIQNIMNSNYPKNKFEVIAINDGSTDNTKEILKRLVRKYKNLRLINKENSGKANSLNEGIKTAKGELIAVVDSDSFPDQDSLRKLTGYFDNDNMGAVTSFVSVRNKEDNFFARIQSIEYLILGWGRKLFHFVDAVWCTNGPLSLYRKKYVEKVGGFSADTVTEDIDITWNMLKHRYDVGMCLDARVTTVVPSKFRQWLRQRTRWGLGGLQAIKKYRKEMFKKGMLGYFVIPFISFTIIVGIFAFLFSSFLVLKDFLTRALITGFSLVSEAPIIQLQEVNLHPSVLLFYLMVLLIFSLFYYNFILYKTKYEDKLTLKRFFNLLFYMLVYLALYPLLWFVAIYRFARRDYKW